MDNIDLAITQLLLSTFNLYLNNIFYVWLRSLYVHFRMKRNIKDTEWRGKIIYKINFAITQPQLSTLIISPFLVNYILLTLENEQKYQRYWM